MRNSVLLIILIFNAILGALVFYSLLEVPLFLYSIYSAIFLLFLLFTNRDNLVHFVRIAGLGVVGILVGLNIGIGSYVSENIRDAQVEHVALACVALTNVALLAGQCGLWLGSSRKVSRLSNLHFTFGGSVVVSMISLSLALFYGFSLGETILTASYTTGSGQIHTGIGNLNSITGTLFFVVALLFFKSSARSFANYGASSVSHMKPLFVFFVFNFVALIVYAEVLHGARAEVLSQLFVTYLIYLSVFRKADNVSTRLFYAIVLVFVLLQVVGGIRSTFSDGISFEGMTRSLVFVRKDFDIAFYQGTLNDIGATFAGLLYLMDTNSVDFQFGQTYLNYVLRTPPAFLYPDRPAELALVFRNFDLNSGGGFFEIAEGYFNFGVLGVLLHCFVISFLLSYLYKQFRYAPFNAFTTIMFFSVFSVLFRGMWYQSYVFYKALITGSVLYALIYFILMLSRGAK